MDTSLALMALVQTICNAQGHIPRQEDVNSWPVLFVGKEVLCMFKRECGHQEKKVRKVL